MKKSTKSSLFTLILFVATIIALVASAFSEASPVALKEPSSAEKFIMHTRCARLAEVAGRAPLFLEHVKIAKQYQSIIENKQSMAYHVGFIDGNIAQIIRATGGRPTWKAVATSLYKDACPSNI